MAMSVEHSWWCFHKSENHKQKNYVRYYQPEKEMAITIKNKL